MEKVNKFNAIGVIGGGAWGTALAEIAVRNGVNVLLWAREPEVAASINDHQENRPYLPGVPLSPSLKATSDLQEVADCEAYLFVVPAQFARSALADLRNWAAPDAPIALCSKGIEQSTGLLLTEVLAQVWPEARGAILSGPSFAKDVAKGLPAAVTLACANEALGQRWAASIGAKHFRPYLSHDLVGAALGGAVKNVLAIAAGVVVGRGLGESARAAIIARGFREMQRLGLAIGAEPDTLSGLSGLGDLILTAGSTQSRNMSLGERLGRGDTLSAILAERNSVAEGVATAQAIYNLAEKAEVDLPICHAVAELVSEQKTVDQVIEDLLSRPFATEESLP